MSLESTVLSNAPRARAIRNLKQWINEGVLPHGQPLPTEQALAEKLDVSRGTLRSALDMLSEEGLIRSNGGRLRIVVTPPASPLPEVRSDFNPRNVESVPVANQAGPVRIGIIGAWTGQSNHYVWNNIAARSMEKVASEQTDLTLHYFNRFVQHDTPRRSIQEAVANLAEQGVERFAVLFRTSREEIESLGALIDFQKTPLVCIQDEGPQNLPVCQVYYDIEHSGYQAADHLLRRGWRSIVVFVPFDAEWIKQRLRGIESAIRVHGLKVEDVLTVWPPDHRVDFGGHADFFFSEIGREIGRDIFENVPSPCGIIAPNDLTAYGLIDAARELNLVAGIDYGIIGFDDSEQSRHYGLSSLRPPIEAMSEEALRLLLPKAPGESVPLRLSFRSELIARTSSEFYAESAPKPQGK